MSKFRREKYGKIFGKMKQLLPVIFPYPDFSFSISTL